MEPLIKTAVAALSTACAAASILYSPMLLLAIAKGDDWRMQMYSPQIDRVPLELREFVALGFALLAGILCVDVCAAYPDRKPLALAGCLAGVGAVAAYWFFWGPIP